MTPHSRVAGPTRSVPLSISGAEVYLLQNAEQTEALSGYTGPNPPAVEPLSHRYTLLLVDLSDIEPEGLEVLAESTGEWVGFEAKAVLDKAGIGEGVIAGTFFNVTNPGPVNGTAGGPPPTEPGGPGATDPVTAGAGVRGFGVRGCACPRGGYFLGALRELRC